MPIPPAHCVINEASIKAATGQFDLESVYKLQMPHMGIRKIEGLALLPNLTELDLSSNHISKIEGLEKLEQLKKLTLANNEIAKLQNLSSLASLESLRLDGNKIANVDDVRCLENLPSLRSLHFAASPDATAADERNPLCDHPAYRTAVRRMLPALAALDGERTALADAAGGADDVAMPELPAPTPWFSPADLELDGGERALSLASSAEWEKSLTDAKRSAQRAKSLAEELASKTPR